MRRELYEQSWSTLDSSSRQSLRVKFSIQRFWVGSNSWNLFLWIFFMNKSPLYQSNCKACRRSTPSRRRVAPTDIEWRSADQQIFGWSSWTDLQSFFCSYAPWLALTWSSDDSLVVQAICAYPFDRLEVHTPIGESGGNSRAICFPFK